MDPAVEWDRDVRHTDDPATTVTDGDELAILASPSAIGMGSAALPAGTPIVPLAIGIPDRMGFECFLVTATATYEDGAVFDTPAIQTLTGNVTLPPGPYENAALVGVALDPEAPEGRVTLALQIQDIFGTVAIWSRTVDVVIN